jgi:prepilin-type N-terminal cleavage/methylation domain-containing protein
MSSRGRPSGFTLVEVLVVLLITALVATLLFQALAQTYRLQARFGEQLTQSQGGTMRVDWYRQLLQGLQANFSDSTKKFSGTSQSLEGLSSSAPSVVGGAMAWIRLDIASDESPGLGGHLKLVTNGQEVKLLSWPMGQRAEFAYLDEEGVEHDQWPPLFRTNALKNTGAGMTAELPVAILFKQPIAGGRRVLAAVPLGGRDAIPRELSALAP